MQNFSLGAQIGPEGSGWQKGRLITFPALNSTNSWALAHLDQLQPGDLVRAIRQTAGRGRHNRVWLAPDNHAFTGSLILDPTQAPVAAPLLGQVAALGVVYALAEFSVEAGVKWPNDVLVKDRKIAGILLEAGDRPDRLVIGIGLNVNLTPADLPPDQLRRPATSIRIETARLTPLDAVVAALIRGWDRANSVAASPEALRLAWTDRDLLRNRPLRVETDSTTWCGRYGGVTLDGQLILVRPDGSSMTFWSAEVDRLDPDTAAE